MHATPRLETVAGKTWDVVIVGAGPAGALAARGLAQLERQVLLVDKTRFPRFKVCGGCLNLKSLAVLEAVGLGELPESLGAVPLSQMTWAAGGRRACIRLPGGMSVSRERFDADLAQAAVAEGVEFLAGVTARVMDRSDDGRHVRLGEGTRSVTVCARIVLVASGLGVGCADEDDGRNRVAGQSLLGTGVLIEAVDTDYSPGTIYMACGRGGYVGITRVEQGLLNVAAALDPAFVRHEGGLGNSACLLIKEAGLPALEDLAQHVWKGTPLLTRRPSAIAGDRLFLLGDAAGYIEPFTGEGMAWALAGARAVVPLADQGCRHWTPELGRRWQATYRQVIRRRQWVCRSLSHLLRHPGLTRGVVRILSAYPSIARPVVHFLNAGGVAATDGQGYHLQSAHIPARPSSRL